MSPRAAAIAALVALAGCEAAPPRGPESAAPASAPAIADALTRHMWARTDPGAPPGDLRIFLADGTLLMDSCFETYRLVRWRMESDSALSWQEDIATLRAQVVAVDDSMLTLRVELVASSEEQHYVAASVPFTCPDMPR
jgi:hypothetical protein